MENWPSLTELQARVRRLISISQKNSNDPTYEKAKFSKKEEHEFMRILRSFGMRDNSSGDGTIDWSVYRQNSPSLEKKTDLELQVWIERGLRYPEETLSGATLLYSGYGNESSGRRSLCYRCEEGSLC